MRKYYFVKHGAPVWIRIPGTPFTFAGFPHERSRLPGMTEWAPQGVVERVGKGLKEDKSVDALAESEKNRGLLASTGTGGVVGGGLGAMAGRLLGGKDATRPFRDILRKGLSRETLQGFKNIPQASKILPLVGAGAGLAGGAMNWASGRGQREHVGHL